MRQSVMANSVTTGSSGVGFALRLVVIQEVLSDQNICRVSDFYTNEGFDPGLNKRGDSAVWPQVGEQWLMDRSMGHWALKCKVTGTRPPAVSGSTANPEALLYGLVDTLTAQGMVLDQTVAPAIPLYQWNAVAPLTNGWVAGRAGGTGVYPAIRYRLLPGNRVELNGWLGGGTTTNFTSMFTLPSACSPALDQFIVGYRHDTLSYFTAKVVGTGEPGSTGQVQFISASGASSGADISIAGVYPLD